MQCCVFILELTLYHLKTHRHSETRSLVIMVSGHGKVDSVPLFLIQARLVFSRIEKSGEIFQQNEHFL